MAKARLHVAAVVQDKASKALNDIDKNMRKVGKSAKQTSVDFTAFNRTMFSASAFVGMFTNSFKSLTESMSKGAELDRVADQFERTLGPKGAFFKSISGFTDAAVDKVEAMRSAIALKTLGIAEDQQTITEIISRAGVAAQRAGLQTTEGIQRVTNALKSGSLAQLEFLNLIKTNNPALKTLFSIIEKGGGVMSTTIAAQTKHNLILSALRGATEGAMHGNKDLFATMFQLKESFKFANAELSNLLTKALTPVIDKIVQFNWQSTNTLELLRKNDKNFLFLTKSVLLATGAIAGLALAVGTLRLSLVALGSLGIGLPAITVAVGAMSLAFAGLTSNVSGFQEKLKVFGGILRGAFQLTSSFFDPENFAQGIGKIDKSLADLLRKHGLLELTKNIARVTIVFTEFAKGVGTGVKSSIMVLVDTFNMLANALNKVLGIDLGTWSKDILSISKGLGTALGAGAVLGGGAYALYKMIATPKAAMSSVTGLLTGSSGKAPKGTRNDPLYVVTLKRFGGTSSSELFGTSKYAKKVPSTGPTSGAPTPTPVATSNPMKAMAISALGVASALGFAASSGYAFGKMIDQNIPILSSYFDRVGETIASAFGMKGSLASQSSELAKMESFGYVNMHKRFQDAGVSIGPETMIDKILPLVESTYKNGQATPQTEALMNQMQKARFGRRLTDEKELGVEGGRIVDIPTIPRDESFREKQLQATIKLVDEDLKVRMTESFKAAMTDGNLSAEELKNIYREAMNTSVVGKKAIKDQNETKPADLTSMQSKRGC